MTSGTPKQINTNITMNNFNNEITMTEQAKAILVSNLKLEIAERARKLRAQRALHAQGLRARLEMRVNRIPQSLKNETVSALLDRYADMKNPSASSSSRVLIHEDAAVPLKSKPVAGPKALTKFNPVLNSKSVAKPEPVVKSKLVAKSKPVTKPEPVVKSKLVAKSEPVVKSKPVTKHKPVTRSEPVVKPKPVNPTRTRGVKRSSNDMASEDKENVNLTVQKRRTKTAAPVAKAATSVKSTAASRAKTATAKPVVAPSGRTLRARH